MLSCFIEHGRYDKSKCQDTEISEVMHEMERHPVLASLQTISSLTRSKQVQDFEAKARKAWMNNGDVEGS